MPIVERAIGMSAQEPVSAYSVFKAAKDLTNNKKKTKKNQSVSPKIKNEKNRAKKRAFVSAPNDCKVVSNLKTSKKNEMNEKAVAIKNKARTSNVKTVNKELNKKQKKASKPSHTHNFKGSEVVSLVEQLYTDDSKKLTKNLQKKKKDIEDYLVTQLEMMDAEDEEEQEEGFASDGLRDEDAYFDSEINSEEFATNESSSFLDDEVDAEELSSTNDDDSQAAEALANAITSKTHKKRKISDVAQSNGSGINTTSKAKKTKKIYDQKIISDKSLSATQESNREYSLLSSGGDMPKNLAKKSNANISTVANVKLEPLSPPPNIVKSNSIEEGKRAFRWLLNPVTVDDFFAKFWEQSGCLIKRQQSTYFGHLISFEAIDKMLLKNHVEFTKNIDVTSYKNGFRETLNPEGRALPPVVWDHYGQGCSIRLLNPQTFLPALFTLSTTMQEYFQCLVGANAYLTPPNSQGFAPHYDDIEAFVLQIEGRKRWKLYKPRSESETLPRYSSKNFTQEEIGSPVLEEVLEPGDVLYFPRGTIHQACTEPGYHSLHITLSVYQKQSFADLFEKMFPVMLQRAITTNVDMRRGLPLHAWQHAGIAFSDNSTKERADLTEKVKQLLHKCIRDMPLQEIVDSAVDQLAKKFQHEALPPNILPAEKLRTVFGSRSYTNERGECVCDYDIDERTNVRLLRANILRLIEEEGKISIYYYLDNSKEYCEYEPNFIEIEASEAASVEVLIKSYPEYVGVSQLPLPSTEHKINLASALWERGLLMMEKPFR